MCAEIVLQKCPVCAQSIQAGEGQEAAENLPTPRPAAAYFDAIEETKEMEPEHLCRSGQDALRGHLWTAENAVSMYSL